MRSRRNMVWVQQWEELTLKSPLREVLLMGPNLRGPSGVKGEGPLNTLSHGRPDGPPPSVHSARPQGSCRCDSHRVTQHQSPGWLTMCVSPAAGETPLADAGSQLNTRPGEAKASYHTPPGEQ